MKKLFGIFLATLTLLTLGGCLASSSSPDGINCDYAKGKPLWEMPLACQTGG